MDQLRVAVDATPLLGQPTGVGQFCRGLLGALAERPDLSASAFAVSWRRRRGIEGLLPEGLSARQRAMPARPLHRSWRRSEWPPVEWFLGATEVVHGTNFVVPPARRAARIVTVHDLVTIRFPELCDRPTLAYPDLIRRALARGAFVHTPSAFVAAEVVATLGADPERVRAVHSGVPRLGPADREAPGRVLPEGSSRYLLAIGTAEPRKDLPGLVRAFDRVAAAHPEVVLVLAGPEGWGSGPLAEALGTARHRARMVRTGWLDDPSLAGLLEQAELLVYPSVYEGFGFPPLQAMAAGVPVVATRAGALPEVLGPAAELVAVGDVDALAGALDRLLADEGRRRALAAAGRARAGQFSWEQCGEGLSALYREAHRALGARS